MNGGTPIKAKERRVGEVVVVDLKGKLTIGVGDVVLRQVVQSLTERGETKILLNLESVGYMDSAGTGELVATHSSAKEQGVSLELLNLSAKVRDLLHYTQLVSVFESYADLDEAVRSFAD